MLYVTLSSYGCASCMVFLLADVVGLQMPQECTEASFIVLADISLGTGFCGFELTFLSVSTCMLTSLKRPPPIAE